MLHLSNNLIKWSFFEALVHKRPIFYSVLIYSFISIQSMLVPTYSSLALSKYWSDIDTYRCKYWLDAIGKDLFLALLFEMTISIATVNAIQLIFIHLHWFIWYIYLALRTGRCTFFVLIRFSRLSFLPFFCHMYIF